MTKATVEFGEFLLAKVGLQDCRHKYPTQLSGGMQRRAELARAMINSAQLGELCHHGCEHAAFHHRGFPVMTAKIIDGNAVARELRETLKKRADALKERGIAPSLAVIVVGDNPASRVYVRNKLSACVEVGVHSELHEFQAGCDEAVVLDEVERLNRDPRVHGILIQLPLPGHFDAGRVTQAIVPEKDVDGLNWCNLGALVATGHSLLEPCTPRAVLALIERAGMAIEGSHAVVVGRSAIVGKPVALMLTARGATVTVCHSKTRDLGQITRLADILVVAAGRPELIPATW